MHRSRTPRDPAGVHSAESYELLERHIRVSSVPPTSSLQAAPASGLPRPGSRLLPVFGGTTTAGDFAVALRSLLGRGELVHGPAIEEYERRFARIVGVAHGTSFSTARVGLYGLLRVFGVEPGDEVLIQAPTHVVVANAIRYAGARPVYVDCTLKDYNIDMALAEQRVTSKTRALVLQHTFGVPADIEGAHALAHRHGLRLIEDCVHALGATWDGRQIGSFGDAAIFSTEETKTISTTMGGMVVTDDAEIAAGMRAFQETCPWPDREVTARRLLKFLVYHLVTEPHLHRPTRALYERFGRRNPLLRPTVHQELIGVRPARYEERLANALAVLGVRQLDRLDENVRHRRLIAEAYRVRLSAKGYATTEVPARAEPSPVRYPVWVADRPATLERMAPHATLGTWFTSVVEEVLAPEYVDYEQGSCPVAEAAARHLVNVPTHPHVQLGDVESIVAALPEPTAQRETAARPGPPLPAAA